MGCGCAERREKIGKAVETALAKVKEVFSGKEQSNACSESERRDHQNHQA
jgi:hypothetical protein